MPRYSPSITLGQVPPATNMPSTSLFFRPASSSALSVASACSMSTDLSGTTPMRSHSFAPTMAIFPRKSRGTMASPLRQPEPRQGDFRRHGLVFDGHRAVAAYERGIGRHADEV